MEVNFYTQKGKYIYLQCYYGANQPFRISTRRKCPERFWNKAKGRAKGSYPEHRPLNAFLSRLEQTVKEVDYQAGIEGRLPEESEFKTALAPFLRLKVKRKRTFTLREFFYRLYEERRSSPRYRLNTTKKYLTALNHIDAFGFPDWQEVSLEWFHDFTNYLFALQQSQNSVAKIVKVLKAFLNEAVRRGHTDNVTHKHPDFHVSWVKSDQVYLPVEELATIYHADVAGRLDKTRDLAMIGAFTGQRWGDWTRISPENFHKTKHGPVFRLRTEKSGRDIEVVIPVHPVVTAIIEKHGGIPRPISAQKFNKYIKELCQVAGIDYDVQITTTRGGIARTETRPKYELISSHTLRRSFVTNSLAAGVPAKVVMDVVGQTKYDTLMKYNVLEKERSAQIVAASEFFRGDRFLRKII